MGTGMMDGEYGTKHELKFCMWSGVYLMRGPKLRVLSVCVSAFQSVRLCPFLSISISISKN